MNSFLMPLDMKPTDSIDSYPPGSACPAVDISNKMAKEDVLFEESFYPACFVCVEQLTPSLLMALHFAVLV